MGNVRSTLISQVITAICAIAPLGAFAGGASEMVPLQELSQGQSLTAANLVNDSIYFNPATAAFLQSYSLEGTFQSTRSFSASVLDTRTSAIGGGLAYSRRAQFDDSSLSAARLALSGRVSHYVGVGLTGKLLWATDTFGNNSRANDIDGGVLVKLGYLPVQLGAMVRNVVGNAQNLGLDRDYAIGARFNFEDTMYFSANLINRINGAALKQFGLGAEYVSPYYFSLKGGYRQLIQESWSYWTAGFSIISPRVSLHYAVEFPSSQPGLNPEHWLGTTILF